MLFTLGPPLLGAITQALFLTSLFAAMTAFHQATVRESGEINGLAGGVPVPCIFATHGDYVHMSTWQPGIKVASAHGWWNKLDCRSATYALVTVTLQAKKNGSWVTISESGSRVKSGGGAGNRATGRSTCRGLARTEWRSIIDVDIIDRPDGPTKLTFLAGTYGRADGGKQGAHHGRPFR
jgi:hypothetical protein